MWFQYLLQITQQLVTNGAINGQPHCTHAWSVLFFRGGVSKNVYFLHLWIILRVGAWAFFFTHINVCFPAHKYSFIIFSSQNIFFHTSFWFDYFLLYFFYNPFLFVFLIKKSVCAKPRTNAGMFCEGFDNKYWWQPVIWYLTGTSVVSVNNVACNSL